MSLQVSHHTVHLLHSQTNSLYVLLCLDCICSEEVCVRWGGGGEGGWRRKQLPQIKFVLE